MSRARCERCARPLNHCLCHLIPRLSSRTRVLILQHPDEVGHALNTARLAALGLDNAELRVGERFADLPLDPAYPRERLAFMIQDARLGVLLTEERLLGVLPDTAVQVVLLDVGGVARVRVEAHQQLLGQEMGVRHVVEAPDGRLRRGDVAGRQSGPHRVHELDLELVLDVDLRDAELDVLSLFAHERQRSTSAPALG